MEKIYDATYHLPTVPSFHPFLGIYTQPQETPATSTTVLTTARSTKDPRVSVALIKTPKRLKPGILRQSIKTEEVPWMRGEIFSSIYSQPS